MPPREAAEAEAAAAAIEQEDWELVTCDAAGLPFGMVGELRRKLSPIAIAVLLLFMGVDLMDIRVSAVFPSSRQRAAFFCRSLDCVRRVCEGLSRDRLL